MRSAPLVVAILLAATGTQAHLSFKSQIEMENPDWMGSIMDKKMEGFDNKFGADFFAGFDGKTDGTVYEKSGHKSRETGFSSHSKFQSANSNMHGEQASSGFAKKFKTGGDGEGFIAKHNVSQVKEGVDQFGNLSKSNQQSSSSSFASSSSNAASSQKSSSHSSSFASSSASGGFAGEKVSGVNYGGSSAESYGKTSHQKSGYSAHSKGGFEQTVQGSRVDGFAQEKSFSGNRNHAIQQQSS